MIEGLGLKHCFFFVFRSGTNVTLLKRLKIYDNKGTMYIPK